LLLRVHSRQMNLFKPFLGQFVLHGLLSKLLNDAAQK
jgi:hypothetical protein